MNDWQHAALQVRDPALLSMTQKHGSDTAYLMVAAALHPCDRPACTLHVDQAAGSQAHLLGLALLHVSGSAAAVLCAA